MIISDLIRKIHIVQMKTSKILINPYKSAKIIDFLPTLLYNYTVFLYLSESEGNKNGFEC